MRGGRSVIGMGEWVGMDGLWAGFDREWQSIARADRNGWHLSGCGEL